MRNRTTTEEFAKDSYENVLFGIARFHECTGSWPMQISVVSWQFKQERFLFHGKTIHWPSAQFLFVGVSNPHKGLKAAIAAEKHTLNMFQGDVSGTSTKTVDALGSKKQARNPYKRQNGYALSCPSISKLLAWEGPEFPDRRICPWREQDKA